MNSITIAKQNRDFSLALLLRSDGYEIVDFASSKYPLLSYELHLSKSTKDRHKSTPYIFVTSPNVFSINGVLSSKAVLQCPLLPHDDVQAG